jgi:hypothetical protein
MKEINALKLKEAINQLPALKAPKGIWKVIEMNLKKHNSLNSLPEYKAPAIVWEMIEKELGKEVSLKRGRTIRLLLRTCAAAIILLMSLYSVRVIVNNNMHFNRLQEIKRKKSDINIEDETDFKSIYNPALCQSNPQICNTPLFKSLDFELNIIKSEIEEMKPLVKAGDPQLLKYYYRLVNERTEIEKRMVKLIMQT